MFNDKMLKRIFGLKGEEMSGNRENFISRCFINCYGRNEIKEDKIGGAYSAHGGVEKFALFFLKKTGIWRIILKET